MSSKRSHFYFIFYFCRRCEYCGRINTYIPTRARAHARTHIYIYIYI